MQPFCTVVQYSRHVTSRDAITLYVIQRVLSYYHLGIKPLFRILTNFLGSLMK